MHARDVIRTLTSAAFLALTPVAAIPLPSPADHVAVAPNPTALLGPDRPNEVLNRSPGPITDEERVRVGVGPAGDVRSVVVHQRLTITGTGDFSLKIPGPALDVKAPPDAPNQPGLRRASVIWEGFSAGTKVLEADVTLDPGLETPKLPLAVTTTPITTRIENRTAIPVQVADADPVPAAAADLLDRVKAELAAGRPAQAGANHIPLTIPGSEPAVATVEVMVPLHVRGTIAGEPIDVVLPGPHAADGSLTVPAGGSVNITVEPTLPDPAGLGTPTGRAALRAAQVALWQVLRLADLAAYLGNPSPGSAVTTFTYEPAAAPPPATAPAKDDPKPIPIAVAIMVIAVLLAGAVVIWVRN